MIYRCLIVDDEPPAVKVLKTYIETVPQLEVCGTCKNAFEVLNYLSERKIDILFLDVHMPKLFGTELLKTIPQPPKVIFTTAHKEFAVEAFELNAVDYLLKPISFERFLKAVNKIIQTNLPVVEVASPPVSFVYFRSERKMIKVFLEDILYVESFRDYVVIHLEERRELKVKIPLNHVESMLPENQFIRIHRSYLVSLSKITAYTKTDVEINRVELPIGKSYIDIFKRVTSNNSNLPDGVEER